MTESLQFGLVILAKLWYTNSNLKGWEDKTMVKLIIGGTGSGKTKELIDQVNAAVKEEKGSVVCISRGNKLTFDISA